jgi:hypothetical protein
VKANEPLPDAHDRNQHLHTTDGGTDLERQLKSTRAEDRKILLAPRPETLQERPLKLTQILREMTSGPEGHFVPEFRFGGRKDSRMVML